LDFDFFGDATVRWNNLKAEAASRPEAVRNHLPMSQFASFIVLLRRDSLKIGCQAEYH
jgi:hypothetical protein